MPKTKRDILKRSMSRAYARCYQAQIHIVNVWQAFKDVHPDDGEALNVMLQTLQLTIDMIEKFAEKAWDITPDEIVAWQNVRQGDND